MISNTYVLYDLLAGSTYRTKYIGLLQHNTAAAEEGFFPY